MLRTSTRKKRKTQPKNKKSYAAAGQERGIGVCLSYAAAGHEAPCGSVNGDEAPCGSVNGDAAPSTPEDASGIKSEDDTAPEETPSLGKRQHNHTEKHKRKMVNLGFVASPPQFCSHRRIKSRRRSTPEAAQSRRHKQGRPE